MAPLGTRSFVIVLVGAIGVSYGLGRALHDDPPAHAGGSAPAALPARAPSPSPVVLPARDPLPLDALRDELRAAIRDELVVLLDERAGTVSGEPASEEPAALTPAQVRDGVSRATALLDGALAAKRMDGLDQAAFHDVVRHLPRAEQEPLLERMVLAINAQELQVDP